MRTTKHILTIASALCMMLPYAHAQIPAEPVWGVDCLPTGSYYAEQLADTSYLPLASIQVSITDTSETPCNPDGSISFGDSIPFFHPLSGALMEHVHRKPNIKTINRIISISNTNTQLTFELSQDIVAYEILPHSSEPLAQPFVYLGYGTIDYGAIHAAINDHPGQVFDFYDGCGNDYVIDVLNIDNEPAIIDIYPWGTGSRAELYWRCSWGQNVKWYIQHVFLNNEPFDPCPPPSNDTLFVDACAQDTVPPVFTELPSLGYSCSDIPGVVLPMVTDNMDSAPTVTHLGDDGSFECISFIIRYYEAMDGCGNSSVQSQEFYINNMSDVWFIDPPSSMNITSDAILPSPYELPIGSSCYAGEVSSATITYEQHVVGIDVMAMATFCAFGAAFHDYVLTSIGVGFHADLQSYTQVPLPATLPPSVDLNDLNDNNIFFYFTMEEDTVFNEFRGGTDTCVVYSVTRTYRTFNAEGTELTDQTFVQIFDVIDEEPPLLEIAPDMMVDGPASIPAPAFDTYDDHGVESVTFTESILNEVCPVNYTLVRTYTATDSCGNETSAIQSIFVNGDCTTVGSGTGPSIEPVVIAVDHSSGHLHISQLDGPAMVEIHDALGRILFTEVTTSNSLALPLSLLAGNGAYIVRTIVNGVVTTERIALVH